MDWNGISRRRLLAGIGSFGIVGAGGLTVATEPSIALDHTAQNGEGLVLDWQATRNNQDDSGSVEDTGTAFTYTVSDVLPGDYGRLLVEMSLSGTSGDHQARLAMDLTETAENTLTDPERAAGDSTPNVGELQDFFDVKIFYDTGTLGLDMWGAKNGEQDLQEGLIEGGTLAEVADALPDTGPNGRELDADPTTPDTDPLTGDNSIPVTFGWAFTGNSNMNINVTQSDSVSFDLIFYAESL